MLCFWKACKKVDLLGQELLDYWVLAHNFFWCFWVCLTCHGISKRDPEELTRDNIFHRDIHGHIPNFCIFLITSQFDVGFAWRSVAKHVICYKQEANIFLHRCHCLLTVLHNNTLLWIEWVSLIYLVNLKVGQWHEAVIFLLNYHKGGKRVAKQW
jgi:hypothetical protein